MRRPRGTGAGSNTGRRAQRVAWFRFLLASAATAAVACSVFEPPSATGDGGATGGSGGATGGSGGIGGVDGGGSAGIDASAGAGGTAGTGGSAGSGGAPTGPWWPYQNTEGCQSAGVPSDKDRPASPGTGTDQSIVLALSRMRFGSAADDAALTPDPNAWQDIGFDIDKSCTASATCSVGDALLQESACKNSVLVPFDGNNCRDNQIGKLFPVAALSPQVGPLFGISEPDWNCALWRGEFSVILKISGYNGQTNDDSVRVDVYTSTGLQSLPNWTCTSGAEGGVPGNWHNQAQWLTTQHWTIAQRSIALNAVDAGTTLPDAKYADPAAYVRNGYLFASLPAGTEIWLDGERAHVPGFRILMHRGLLVGKLGKQQDGTWKISQGTIGGVVLPTEILNSFREIGFCQNMCQDYQNVVGYLNTNQDTLSSTDAKLPNTPCDSLSIGIGFEALQATADATDVVKVQDPVDCPQPANPLAPRQGCVCPDPKVGGPCVLPEGGADAD